MSNNEAPLPQTYGDLPEPVLFTAAPDPGVRTLRARFCWMSGAFALVSKAEDPFRWTVEIPSHTRRRAGKATSIEDGFARIHETIRDQPRPLVEGYMMGVIYFSDGGYVTSHPMYAEMIGFYEWVAFDSEAKMIGYNTQARSPIEVVHASIMGYVSIRNGTHTPRLDEDGVPIGTVTPASAIFGADLRDTPELSVIDLPRGETD